MTPTTAFAPRVPVAALPTTLPHCRAGIDLTSVEEVAAAVSRFGDRYLVRIFTEHERSCCVGSDGVVAAGLAARFAAKEAAIKVLRPVGVRPPWRSIEVQRAPGGACDLHLTGAAAELAADADIAEMTVSLTHEGEWAAAVVVAVRHSCEPGHDEDEVVQLPKEGI